MQNEKVRDVHSSVTPCQHRPHHLPQSVNAVQMLAPVQMLISTEGLTATLLVPQSLWLLRLLFNVKYVVFLATVPYT